MINGVISPRLSVTFEQSGVNMRCHLQRTDIDGGISK